MITAIDVVSNYTTSCETYLPGLTIITVKICLLQNIWFNSHACETHKIKMIKWSSLKWSLQSMLSQNHKLLNIFTFNSLNLTLYNKIYGDRQTHIGIPRCMIIEQLSHFSAWTLSHSPIARPRTSTTGSTSNRSPDYLPIIFWILRSSLSMASPPD